MLSGDNGILQRTKDAKTKSDEAQIREKIQLAYHSALAEGLGNITEDSLKVALTKEFGVEGIGYTIDTINDGKQWKIIVNEIEYNIDKPNSLVALGNNKIKLECVEVETEFLSTKIEVSLDKTTLPTVTNEEKITWLKTLSTNKLKEIFAQSQYGIGETWERHYSNAPFSDVKGYFEYGPKASGAPYEDEYDWMIKDSNYNNDKLNYLYLMDNNLILFSPVTIQCGNEQNLINSIFEKTEFIVTQNGLYTIVAKNEDGDTGRATVNVTKCKIQDLAKDKLILKENEDETTESPYVNFRYAKDKEPILCKVLYDINSDYGLQIVSVNPVTGLKLGKSDQNQNVTGRDEIEKSINSYNRAIQTLNEEAEKYKDSKGIAIDARCVGSNPKPKHKNDDEGSTSYTTKDYGTVNIKNVDSYYTIDETALKNVDAFTINDSGYYKYWLASRMSYSTWFAVRAIDTHNYSYSRENVCYINNSQWGDDDVKGYNTASCGIRPVFLINSNTKINGGNGTKELPYELIL